MYEKGHPVTWQAQGPGYIKRLSGKIVAVVPPGSTPDQHLPKGVSEERVHIPDREPVNHEQYIVAVRSVSKNGESFDYHCPNPRAFVRPWIKKQRAY